MLKANKNRLFERIFTIYNRNLLKRRFHSFSVSGFENLTELQAGEPLIIYSNHSSWWDGLIIFEICRRANLDFYVMMEEKQLNNLPLFRALGAFSVVRENPRKAVVSINYALELLKSGFPKTLLIFPQGKIHPNDSRPIIFYNGLSRLIEKTENASVVPVAIKLEFLGEFKPEVFVKIGKVEHFSKNLNLNSKTLTQKLTQNLTEILDSLKFDISNTQKNNYKNIFQTQ